ncbi:hypothetical protein GRX03_03640 [Halovenus sp. WSH3]|uniref:DUF8052 domain-containing protein n=1 Tax=Halovenus carboxidivorans TaxID=2692199 RepID=A0A6B0T660_9EURY|nr:hypothetical protein [Halovenus carboxidivorans]MXR50701.1 hypothetical protein [Halovenus carboxidivorans]
MSNVESGTTPEDGEESIPTWDDEYFEQVGGRLAYHYDLERDYRVDGERFTLYGEMVIENKKHFLHPSIEIGNHWSYEYLFARRRERVTEDDLDRLVELGHDLADERIDPDEEHYSSEFTFVTVTSEIPDAVRSRVSGLDERTLLKYGYNGHYEVNLVVVAPEQRELVANDAADVKEAFTTWDDIERDEPGLLRLIARRFQL